MRAHAGLALATAMMLGGCDSATETQADGTLKVVVATSGALPDADGYQVTLAGRLGSALGANAEWSADELTPGSYTLQLTGVATNCTIEGDNPRSILVEPGRLVTITFVVACTASVRIVTETTGIDVDASGFLVAIGTGALARLPTSGSTVVPSMADGTLPVEVSDVAANCVPDPGNPTTVSVTQVVTDVTLRFNCARATGEVAVTLSTQSWSGECDNLAVLLDDARLPLIAGKVTHFKDVATGPHVLSIELMEGCSAQGASSVPVTVLALQTASVQFQVYGVF
jgi:hypothetical protein